MLTLFLMTQEVPKDLAKSELPKAALCIVCEALGSGHGEERPAAGVLYRGNRYYFCNPKEVKTFKEDPEGFLPLALPRPLPEFEVVDTTGKRWKSADFAGKTVLIDWWATWCGPCKEMMPVMEALAKKHGENLTVLSISVDEKKEAFDKFLAQKQPAGIAAWDAQGAFAKFRIKSIPAFFLVKDGQIVKEWRGKQKLETFDRAIGN